MDDLLLGGLGLGALWLLTRPTRDESDEIGHSPEEYERVPCGKCGGTEKHLNVTTDPKTGYAGLILACRECGYGNRYTGRVDTDCF